MGQMTIYKGHNFDGDKKAVDYNEANLWGSFWNDEISSISVTSGEAVVYKDANLEGTAAILGPGNYNWKSLADVGLNNEITSWQFLV